MRLEAPERLGKLEQYPEADLVVYRIPDPVGFLKTQKNLHRIQVKGDYRGEGLSNALRYVWDSGYKKSRIVWQRVFSAKTRATVVAQQPVLKQTPPHSYKTQFDNNPQFKLLSGFEPVTRFRYPLWAAKPIQPPLGVELAGSSSEFIEPQPGNILIPLGKLKPGLYLVEAYIGKYRATTLVFVADTVAITKISSEQLLVWTADKKTGAPSPAARLLLTDGTGTLQSGVTNHNGVLVIQRHSPERSYVIGADAAGGVFVSENFYYDSEIYAAKLYAFTDRPLYRPGDTVCVKLVGRVFQESRRSTLLEASAVRLAVLDPNGTPVTTQDFNVVPEAGGDTCFSLPDQTLSGGYALQLGYQGALYTAAFRVAEYIKPHYDIDITFNQKEFKTGEPVKGRVKLSYPGGGPVKNAQLELAVRAQPLTMVEGELRYQGRFPVKLLQNQLAVATDGSAVFELPAAQIPSRYVLNVISTDGAAYRVTASKEIRIQAGALAYAVTAAKRLSRIGEMVEFTASPLGNFTAAPVTWEAVRLEDQSLSSGSVAEQRFAVRFERSGSYTVNLKDHAGHIAGRVEHWVAGPELKTSPGSIAIVLDQEEYRVGETARALITFPFKVDHALLTLERDRVEAYGLLAEAPPGIRLTRQNDLQWSAEIPVRADFPPNITLSLLYVQDGGYVFQNKGIKAAVPAIHIAFTPDKAEYLPGETVTVDVETTLESQPTSAYLAVSVVDEMVYVLQPEIAAPINDFFYHTRRNQVRTASSLNFHSYDMALSAVTDEAAPTAYSQRVLKVPERPRRENIDTAAWLPNLKTDANGKTRFSFIMPDSISRWRITGRATTPLGSVGQNIAYLLSSKDYYLKWSGPAVFRDGDEAKISVVGFNMDTVPVTVMFSADGMGTEVQREIELQPGANDLEVSVTAVGRGGFVNARLFIADQPVDQVQKWITVVPQGWPDTHSLPVTLGQKENEIKVPVEAVNIRLNLVGNAAASFLQVADTLIDYPFGCVEQTASRLIPLALAYQHIKTLGLSDRAASKLRQQLSNHRLRLARMAGPKSAFGWWGDISKENLFLTAYAYYADWNALQALGIQASASHWEQLLEVYKTHAEQEPLLHRVIVLWLMRQMGLPTRTLVEGVLAPATNAPVLPENPSLALETSRILDAPITETATHMALILLKQLAEPDQVNPELQNRMVQAQARLATSKALLAQALVLLVQAKSDATGPDLARAKHILAALRPEMATIDRALSLIFVQEALAWRDQTGLSAFDPGKNWVQRESKLGMPLWYWQGKTGDHVRIALKEPPTQPLSAYLTYDGYGLDQVQLPITIERRLYRLQRPTAAEATQEEATQASAADDDEEGQDDEEEGQESRNTPEKPVYAAIRVEPEWDLAVSDLYLDEVVISPATVDVAYRYGVLEIPLPPGVEVEPTTWGINIGGLPGEDKPVNLSEPIFTPGRRSYSVPVDELSATRVYRHLVRFSQRGVFGLPPVRYFRMYRPNDKALEAGFTIRRVHVR